MRRILILSVAVGLLAAVACTSEKPRTSSRRKTASAQPGADASAAAVSPVGTSQNVLQKTFSLKSSAEFPFEIPAHAVQPHLHGIFQSFLGQIHGASDESADVDFLLLNEEQHNDLTSNHPSEALFTVEASHNQAVNFDLPASMNAPVKYYLVFRNPEGGKAARVVEANFRVDF